MKGKIERPLGVGLIVEGREEGEIYRKREKTSNSHIPKKKRMTRYRCARRESCARERDTARLPKKKGDSDSEGGRTGGGQNFSWSRGTFAKKKDIGLSLGARLAISRKEGPPKGKRGRPHSREKREMAHKGMSIKGKGKTKKELEAGTRRKKTNFFVAMEESELAPTAFRAH